MSQLRFLLLYRWVFPELKLFNSPRKQNSAFFHARKIIKGNRWLTVCGALLSVSCAFLLYWCNFLPDFQDPFFIPCFLAFAILSYRVYVAVLILIMRHRVRLFLRQELVAQGLAICVECGYDLRGQVEPRCPECGTPFDPRLLQSTPPSAVESANDP